MNKTVLTSSIILCILSSVLVIGLTLNIQTVKASGTIYIRADGSVDPPTTPISSADNITYTFTDNINDFIVVERSNIIIDGVGYAVVGDGSGNGFSLNSVSNVTIKKANIRGFYYGVYLNSTSGCFVLENNVTANSFDGVRLEQSSGNTIFRNNATGNGNDGVKIWSYSNNNVISENKITGNNNDGIQLNECLNNSIYKNNVTANSFDGVRIRYSSNNDVYGNKIANNRYGIELLSSGNTSVSENNSIHGNNITANSLCGIYLDFSSNNNILGNKITNNYDGVDLQYSSYNTISENNITANDLYGIWLERSPDNIISGNSITANSDIGVYIRYSSNNDVYGNKIANNFDGIWLSGSLNTNISGNNVRDNYNGIGLLFGSSNNRLYHNNIINNTQQASSTSANSWDDGLEGNYWSDYTGVDSDRDGIGDSALVIDASNVDNFPLMGMFSSFNTSLDYDVNIISNSTIDDFEFFKSPANITIRMHVSNMTSNQTSGFCRVSIPHALMTEPYNVTIDGAEPNYANYTLHDNGTHRWIYFNYNHSTLEVIIQGTDNTPPTISVLSPENKTYPISNVPLNFTVNEPTSWIGYSLDGQTNVTIGSNTTLVGLSDDLHSIIVFANDTVGNMGYSGAVNFAVDTLPPNIVILSPENRTYATKSVSLNFTIDETASWIGYSLDGQTNVTIVGNTTLADLLDGSHYVAVYANDTVGSMGASDMVYFTVDATPPNITDVSQTPPENNVLPEDEVKINATVIDELNEVKQATLNYTNGNGTWIAVNMTNLEGNVWNATIPAFPYCTNVTYVVMAQDNVSNTVTTEEMGYDYQYHVIPEFSSLIFLPLFMITTLLLVIAYRRKHYT